MYHHRVAPNQVAPGEPDEIMSLSVIPVNTHPSTFTSRDDVRSLVIARIDRKAPNAATRALQAIRDLDAMRVQAGGELDTLTASILIS